MDSKNHWETVYTTKAPTEVSWYRPHLDTSLRLIEEAAGEHGARIIDVGGGESTLVDDLSAAGHRELSVLDISLTALEVTKARLGTAADAVQWLCGDITSIDLPHHHYDVWHDRAVFHFLTDAAARAAYVRQAAHAVKPGGHVIVATFGPEGPTKCSGLDVVRYAPDALHDQFGPAFQLDKHTTEMHRTPTGSVQQFTYCYCRVASGLN